MSKSELIKTHRKHLIGRLLARNPLLRFRAPAKSGRRIDVCDLFSQEHGLPGIAENATAADFFRNLMENKRATLQLPDASHKIAARLLRIKKEAEDLRRATGTDSLFWAWPFVRVPCEGRKPLSSPLLFWKVNNISISGETLTVVMSEDEPPKYNFMLEEWLKIRHNSSLKFTKIAGEESGEDGAPDAIATIRKIGDMAAQWAGCRNGLSEDMPYQLRKYGDFDDAQDLAILPCAVLGVAYFKYLTLLQDLETLEKKADSGDGCGLLDEFLGTPSDAVCNSPLAREPEESDKYLVEKTDVSQERAVWQARKSAVMLLKGPPGTGKSQTIVNLIADAMQKDKSVALICQKQAALDVVKKRLAGIGLGDLTVQIIDPPAQRRAIVREIKGINDEYGGGIFGGNDNRGGEASKIAQLESKCDKISLSRGSKEGVRHSIRGDLRGKIEIVRAQTQFTPFDSAYENFIATVQDIADGWTEDERQNMPAILAHFAEDFRECDYANNLWKDVNMDPAQAADIRPRFNALAENAKRLDDAGLPDARFAPILFGQIARAFAHQFFSGAKRREVGNMTKLIIGTTRVFADAGIIPTRAIWNEVYQGAGGAEYRRYANDMNYLAEVASINQRIGSQEIIRAFIKERDDMENWKDILHAILCYAEWKEIPPVSLTSAAKDVERLRTAVKEKRRLDSAVVRRRFNQRRMFADTLNKKKLLWEKPFRNRCASTVRDIVHHGAPELKQIYPAMLMNPDSMCQIFPLAPGVIDMAIVDEASQMFLADAMPILYRAKSIVISGDNMQMPPDDLFALRTDENDENGEDERDMPAEHAAGETYELLEAAENLVSENARRKLRVHYRSRPAELIAFSNHAFYGGELQAAPDNYLPSPPLRHPIEVVKVPGQFSNGVNNGEIDEIVARLREIWAVENPPSAGVIVLNVKQAEALKDRLEEEAQEDADFNDAYQKSLEAKRDGEDAGFFVRSVEHVQGDERDVIVLGTTYENEGSYGILSISEKGRRRLNVAVTRAKLGMFVITSLDIDRISSEAERPGNDQSMGERERWYLWKFMEYARAVSNGERDVATEILQSVNSRYRPPRPGENPDSQFEIDVAEFIRGLGYAVDYQIGESGFRIDLGVKRTKEDRRYLCGIECDGRFWHSGWRARHNDIWRQDILESKGWKIYRIWSDYWYDRLDDTQQKLRKHLERLCAESEQ